MAWFILIIAGLFETGWAIGLKYSDSFSKLTSSIITIILMIISIVLLSIAMKNLPVGIAYLVWTAIGAVGTIIGGIILFNDSFSMAQAICIAFIIGGVVGLKLVS
ncbi:DMT family transporter [Gilliamella sp. wkB112]|uniref:DMT family transporter n=1 Tax=Gilliamella sp. wkB112 TaxID=3120257 RepID=UPI00080E3E40|nr:multidrug efflux SMR transporter [Gilliamella apicola]OCG03050.1 molecular chaperone [Gilliamella apicola]